MEEKMLPSKESVDDLNYFSSDSSSEYSEPERQSVKEVDEEETDMHLDVSNLMSVHHNSNDDINYLPEDFKKSVEILHNLNTTVKSLSFISSRLSAGDEEVIDESFWNKMIKEEEYGVGKLSAMNFKLRQNEGKFCVNKSVDDLSSPSYAKICEFKDAMKDAVMQLKLI